MGALVRLVTSCEDNKKKNTELKYLFGLISTKKGVNVIVNQYDFDIFDNVYMGQSLTITANMKWSNMLSPPNSSQKHPPNTIDLEFVISRMEILYLVLLIFLKQI